MTVTTITTTGKRLYRIPEVLDLLSISRSVLYEQMRSGRLRSVKQGRTRLVPASALGDYVALLEREAHEATEEGGAADDTTATQPR